MNKLWGIALALATATALLAPTANAAMRVGSGDTCTYSGSGTAYTVDILAGAGVQEYGFAVGAPGVIVKNISISGVNGNFGTSSMPSGANGNWGGWTSDVPLTGSLVATLTVSGAPTGKFAIVPLGQSQSQYNKVACTLHVNPAKPSVDIEVTRVRYSASAHGWHLLVKVPVAGTLSAVQPIPTNITPVLLLKQKALVQTHSIGTKTGGLITLTLKPTSSGQVMLAAKSMIKVKLRVTFDARSGLSTHKTVSLTLRR